MLRRRQIHSVLPTCPQSSTPNTKFNLSIKSDANENWLLNPRPPTISPPRLDPHHGNDLQLDPRTNYREGSILKREASAPIPDVPRKRIAPSQIHPSGRASSDHSHQTGWKHWGVKFCRILGITPVGVGAAGIAVAELSIPWEILTSDRTRIPDRILTVHGILTMIRILTRILVLARILTGTPIPARTLTRIKLIRILTRILVSTRISTRILTPSRIITGIPILARALIRILVLDGNLEPEEILILGSTLVSVPEEIETSARIQAC